MPFRFCPVHQCLVSPKSHQPPASVLTTSMLSNSSVESTPTTEEKFPHLTSYFLNKALECGAPLTSLTSEPMTLDRPASVNNVGVGAESLPDLPIEPRKRRARALSSANHPPRPLNSFMTYRQHHVAEIAKNHPKVDNRQISRIAGAMWKREKDEVKLFWQKQAELGKKEHARLYPNYKYRPKKRRSLKAILGVGNNVEAIAKGNIEQPIQLDSNINGGLDEEKRSDSKQVATIRRRAFSIATSKPSENAPPQILNQDEELWQSWADILDFPGWKDAGNSLVEQRNVQDVLMDDTSSFNPGYLVSPASVGPTRPTSSSGSSSYGSGEHDLINHLLLNIQTSTENPLLQPVWTHEIFDQINLMDEVDVGSFWNDVCAFSQEKEEVNSA